jgi:hypothetical protein
MKKGKTKKPIAWTDHDQLQAKMSRQTKIVNSFRKTQRFDPHKYFGGWDPIERSSIEKIKMDIRLMEMMEYESSRVSLSKSF